MRQLNLNTSWALVSLMSTLAAACSGGGGNGSGTDSHATVTPSTDSRQARIATLAGPGGAPRAAEKPVVAREDQRHFTAATEAAYVASENTQPIALPDAALQTDADDDVYAFATLPQ